jgi:TonB family protein
MELIKDKNSRSGIVGTVLVHLLLLLLFVSFGMPYQDPPPVNEGAMVIDFGNSGGGSPAAEAENESNESSANSASNSEETSESNSSPESLQATEEETIEVNASQNTSEETQETVNENLNEALDALKNANNSNSNNENSNSSNNSNSNSESNGPNTGPTNGIGYSLGNGRGKVSFTKPENPTQEDGKVVVDIVVDRNGKVVRAKSGARGSTTTNPVLQKKAEEAAYKAKFKKDSTAPFEQKGTMTFVFILN